MRSIDAKILDELEMLYGDKDCFHPLRKWFGTARGCSGVSTVKKVKVYLLSQLRARSGEAWKD